MYYFAVKNAYRYTLAMTPGECQLAVIDVLHLSRTNYEFKGSEFHFWASQLEHWQWGLFDDSNQEYMHVYIKGHITPRGEQVELYWEIENIQEALLWVVIVAIIGGLFLGVCGLTSASWDNLLCCSFPGLAVAFGSPLLYYYYRSTGLANFYAQEAQIITGLMIRFENSLLKVEKITPF